MEKLDRSALLVLQHYNDYASGLVLETAARMTPGELERESSPSHGTVKCLLLHYLLCEYGFLVRCGVTPMEDSSNDPESLDLSGIRELSTRISALWKDYLAKVTEADLEEVVEIRIMGRPLRLARWQMLAQALLQSIHHRGELSIVMTSLGYPLPTLDPILQFIRESGQEWPAD
jgi:uncharacterized damage-inducible protein DinB